MAAATGAISIQDETGVVQLAGDATFPDGIAGIVADGLADTFAVVTVVSAPPTTFVSPLMFDDTAVTGGLYAWDGAAYVQVGAAL